MNPAWTQKPPDDSEALHRLFDEQQVIERSVLGTLKEPEQAIFEAHFLTCDRCLDQLEACQRLRTGLQGVAVEEVARQQQLGWWARKLTAWRRWTTHPAALTAWSLALVWVTSATVWWHLDGERQQLRERLEVALSPPDRTFIVPLDATRSTVGSDGAPVQILRLAGEAEWLVLTLPTGGSGATSRQTTYSVSLEDAEGQSLWQRRGVPVGNDGRLAFGLPSSALRSGSHWVILQAEGSSAEARRFPISIQRTDR